MQIVIDIPEEIHELCIKDDYFLYDETTTIRQAIKNGISLSKDNKCKWIHYDYRTVCPREHDVDNPYWRIPKHRMDTLKYCPYCGKEIEIEADKEE